ncbi:UNVERIFIED_CONTAM: hypothetical protein K2H54_046976 [Gekko kuhli]
MRKYFLEKKNETVEFRSVNIHLGDVTPRISFNFIVTMPNNDSDIVPRSEVEEAIRISRGRINEIFQLDDQTLEFIGIAPTLEPPYTPPVTVWLILFGIVMGIVIVAMIVLIINGQRNQRKKRKATENELSQTTIANRHDNSGTKNDDSGGQDNLYYLQDDECSSAF